MVPVFGQAEKPLQGDTFVREAGEAGGSGAGSTFSMTEHLTHLPPLQPLAPSAVHPNQDTHQGEMSLVLQDWLPATSPWHRLTMVTAAEPTSSHPSKGTNEQPGCHHQPPSAAPCHCYQKDSDASRVVASLERGAPGAAAAQCCPSAIQ